MTEKMIGQQAQGDILFTRVEALPGKAKRQKSRVIAEGEATGHHHELMVGEMYRLDDKVFVVIPDDVPDGSTVVVHPEHGPLILSPGVYEVDYQIEVDPFTGLSRRVLD